MVVQPRYAHSPYPSIFILSTVAAESLGPFTLWFGAGKPDTNPHTSRKQDCISKSYYIDLTRSISVRRIHNIKSGQHVQSKG